MVRPSVRQPQVTVTRPGSGAADSRSTSLAGTSASRSCSIARCAVPGPATTSTATPPVATWARRSVSARSVSPRYDSTSCTAGAKTSSRPETSGLSVTTGRPVDAACSSTSSRPRYALAPTSIGASPPIAGGEPARLEELLAGADEVRAAGADALGIGEQHRRADRQQVGEQVELGAADQRRDQRLHALGRDALGEALQQLAQGGVVLVGPGERRGPVAHLDGEQQLPAPGRVQDLDGDDRALIGDGEAAQLADLVAPELDAHGVLGRGREDVDDPAADGELAARGDHLDPRVRQLDEPDQQAVEVVGVADAQRHRLQPAQAGCDRLDQAACGGDDQPRRGGRVGEAPEDRQPAADGVRARRQPLVRQRLPAGQHGDGVATEQVRRRRAPRSSASRSVAVTASTCGRRRRERRRGTAAAPTGPRRPAPGRRWRAGRGMRR